MLPGPVSPASCASTVWRAHSQARRSPGFLTRCGFMANSALANSISPAMRKRSLAASSVASGRRRNFGQPKITSKASSSKSTMSIIMCALAPTFMCWPKTLALTMSI
eukprot:10556702-Heterocapsa_arctica.AAC.1